MTKKPDPKQKPATKRRKDDRAGGDAARKNDIQPPNGPRVDPRDPVEEASQESFPASDPPSFNPG